MTDSSNDNYPIADEPTRDLVPGNESIQFAAAFDEQSDDHFPRQIGDYVIKELIGSGGMGQVFLAEHTRMQRVVAIKMLPVDRMKDVEAIESFYEEVRAASRLLHPNIVTAFDAGEFEGIHYLAMEYVDGMTLTEVVSKNGPLSVGEAASVIRQTALGLLHAHRAGIVHRDVKPGNLMRATDGTVKVLDLGLAQISTAGLVDEDGMLIDTPSELDATRSAGRLVGTLPFMSPEQLENPDTVDPRSDIYSLGATLFFLLTGRPPFSGEYLDQVYGHRHGEIPDLMQIRDDVDLKFANIFRRMMAKTPDQRYGSLDEVIDDLSGYSDTVNTPLWLAEFAQRQTVGDVSTVSGGSTSGSTARVLAIDLGMFYSATAEATPAGDVNLLPAASAGRPLFRMAIASNKDELFYGDQAMKRRGQHPHHLVHCLPMYIGKPLVEREIAGRKCPPEVLLAMLLRQIKKNAWTSKSAPAAAAITVPASYDQLHRQSVLQAARMAGLRSVRLVDRSLAAVQTLLLEPEPESLDAPPTSVQSDSDKTILFVGLSGQASEVAVIHRDSSRLHQLATDGHWHTGTLPWIHRLVDLTAIAFIKKHQIDPRKSSATASALQISCERAMNSMLLWPTVDVTISVKGARKSVSIDRQAWIAHCDELIVGVRRSITNACKQAAISLLDVDVCVTHGPLLRLKGVRNSILRGLNKSVEFHSVDRVDVARGAAACLAGELPGRGDIARPPSGVTSQTIGIVVEDKSGRRRILPIIAKGTTLPARTNRRLTVGKDRATMTLSLVESSGVASDDWHSLGRYDFEIGDQQSNRNNRMRMIGFEVDMNGILSIRAQAPALPEAKNFPPFQHPCWPKTKSQNGLFGWTGFAERSGKSKGKENQRGRKIKGEGGRFSGCQRIEMDARHPGVVHHAAIQRYRRSRPHRSCPPSRKRSTRAVPQTRG